MTSSAASDTDSARNRDVGLRPAARAAITARAAAAGHVDVEQHDVGLRSRDHARRPRRRRRPRPRLDGVAELGAHAGQEQPWSSTRKTRTGGAHAGHAPPRQPSSTSVPSPGAERIVGRAAVALHAPEDRLARCPRRSSGTVAGSNPRPAVADEHDRPLGRRPRRRRDTPARAGVLGGVDHRLAAAATTALAARRRAARRRRRPTSTGTPCASSTSAAGLVAAAPAQASARRGPRGRTATRAARAPGARASAGDLARVVGARWISARVCSTESCRCAATSAAPPSGCAPGAPRPVGGEPHDPRTDDERQAGRVTVAATTTVPMAPREMFPARKAAVPPATSTPPITSRTGEIDDRADVFAARRLRAQGEPLRPRATGAIGADPDDGRPDGRQRHGPHEGVAEPEPQRPEHEQGAGEHRMVAIRPLPPAAAAHGLLRRGVFGADGEQDEGLPRQPTPPASVRTTKPSRIRTESTPRRSAEPTGDAGDDAVSLAPHEHRPVVGGRVPGGARARGGPAGRRRVVVGLHGGDSSFLALILRPAQMVAQRPGCRHRGTP